MERVNTTQWSLAVVGTSAVLALLFNFLVFEFDFGVGLSLYIGLLIVGFVGLAHYSGHPMPQDCYWLLGLLAIFAGLISIRANPLLTVLNTLSCIFVMLLCIEVYVRGSIKDFRLSDYLQRLFPPFQWIDPLMSTLESVLATRAHLRKHERSAAIVRGIVITVPIVVLFAALFSSADPVFGRFFSNIFAFDISDEFIARTVITAIIATILSAGYSYSYNSEAQSRIYAPMRWLGQVEGTILFGSINVLFLAFILVQITYFFGGAHHIAVAGMTYAEYARRGFFELLAVAGISYLLLLAAENFIQRDTDTHTTIFKTLSIAIVLQVGVIMTSSFMRLSLYEDAFGFTTLRLYSHAFILFLAVIFAILLYKILLDHRENVFAFRTFIAIAAFVLCMNAFNPDAFIASKNIARYESSGKIDTEYLALLSQDAHAVLLRTFDTAEGDLRASIGNVLWKNIPTTALPLQSWNSSRVRAANDLRARASELATYQHISPDSSSVAE